MEPQKKELTLIKFCFFFASVPLLKNHVRDIPPSVLITLLILMFLRHSACNP